MFLLLCLPACDDWACSPHIVSIHILDDDSLLNIFYLCRPFFLGEDGNDSWRLHGGVERWDQGRWWYRPAHVCQRWRNLILGSASYLGLSLVCANGTPVGHMLAHSPPLPLTVDYSSRDDITAVDEEGILFALQHSNRVRHLRLNFPVQNLQKFVKAIDKGFPILEYLIVLPLDDSTVLMLPETLQAPRLRHLFLSGFACPIRPRLHPTAMSLVTLYLTTSHPSAYFQPNTLLQWISFMPQLESLVILFNFPVPNRDVERQLTHTPITTHITLPNLRLFWFRGVSAYLKAVVCRMTAPRLEKLEIRLFKQLAFSIPRFMQFMDTTENVRFDSATIVFGDKIVCMWMYIRETDLYAFGVTVDCWHLDWQVSSLAQICDALGHVLSVVEHLTLRHEVHGQSSEEHNEVDRSEWRKLLRSLGNVKTLRVEDGLVEELSHSLRLEDEELSLELLPELQELTYSESGTAVDAGNAFTSFIDARQNAGRPVTLVRHDPNPSPSESESSSEFEIALITSASDEAREDLDT